LAAITLPPTTSGSAYTAPSSLAAHAVERVFTLVMVRS